MDPIGDREPGDMRILWGRVGALGGALLVAFLLGAWLSGDGGDVDQEEWDRLVTELEEARAENEELNDYIDELSATPDQEDPPTVDDTDDTDDTDDGAADDEDDAATADTDGTTDGSDAGGTGEQIYRVRSGDSLTGIAQRFYGDTDEYERIVEANDLDPDESLQVGQELVVPPADE